MEFLIILLLIILNGFFAMSEIAMISARRSNLEMQARQGDAGARQAQKLIEDPDKFLSTIQIGITLIGILTGKMCIRDRRSCSRAMRRASRSSFFE